MNTHTPTATAIIVLALSCPGCSWRTPTTANTSLVVSAEGNNLVVSKTPELIAATNPTPGWLGYTIERNKVTGSIF